MLSSRCSKFSQNRYKLFCNNFDIIMHIKKPQIKFSQHTYLSIATFYVPIQIFSLMGSFLLNRVNLRSIFKVRPRVLELSRPTVGSFQNLAMGLGVSKTHALTISKTSHVSWSFQDTGWPV